MKHLTAVLALFFLLCGCAQESPETTLPETQTAPIADTSPTGFYDAGSPSEQQYHGALRAYPLNRSDAQGLLAFGDGLLLFSGEETTTLTMLKGDVLYPSAEAELDFPLDVQDPSIVVSGQTLSFFDSENRETLVLDQSLKVVSRIPAPEDLVGTPVLTQDRNTLYYCTSNALRAWDQESGIRRAVKEMAHPGQTVAGVYQNGTIVHCQTEEGHLFLTADTGRLVKEWEEDIALSASGDQFCAAITLGLNPVLVFGTGADTRILLPDGFHGQYLCLADGGALRVSTPSERNICLEYFDLSGQIPSSVLMLESAQTPAAAAKAADGFLYILTHDSSYGSSTIYRWDTASLTTNRAAAGDYATESDPLTKDLAQCQAFAEELSETHGIEILIGEAAVQVQPWDYDLEAETQPALLMRELELLEARLEQYPEGMLADTASNFTSLKLCLVRSVTGSAESGSLDAATGVQFLDGTDAYVAITVGKYAQQALYHELFHVMETHIFNYSIAFDQWEKLNPSGFDYAYGYAANESRDSGIYLQPEYRSFVDAYSMSFPKEDRARIFEYAMLDGNRELFEAPGLQVKLKAICDGIREAYGLEKSEETFLWEQYLK